MSKISIHIGLLILTFCAAFTLNGCGAVQRDTQKVSYENIDLGKKLPMTVRVSFAPSIDKLIVTSSYDSSTIVNNERQSDHLTVNLGPALKESFASALKGRFAEVFDENSRTKGIGSTTYNPYNTTVILEIDADQPQTTAESGAGAARNVEKIGLGSYSVTMNTRIRVKSVTGEVFENLEYTARGSGKLGTGGAIASRLSAQLTLGMSSGVSIGQQLQNGSESLMMDLIRQALQHFNSDFTDEFTEFTAYSAAMKSRSVADLQNFLDKYPRGKRARKVAEVMDTQLYEFAKSTNMLESNIEYLDKMPKGKYRAEVKAKVEPMIYGEIVKGNTFFCTKYLDLLPDGGNVNDVRIRCEKR